MEDSERGRYVTEQVAVWIENDGDYIKNARTVAKLGTDALAEFLREVIQRSRRSSAPWQVSQELAPNDWARIDWAQVAQRIKAQF